MASLSTLIRTFPNPKSLQPKEKTEAKVDNVNPEIVDKTTDNTFALDEDEKKAGMRSRCVFLPRMDIVLCNIRL